MDVYASPLRLIPFSPGQCAVVIQLIQQVYVCTDKPESQSPIRLHGHGIKPGTVARSSLALVLRASVRPGIVAWPATRHRRLIGRATRGHRPQGRHPARLPGARPATTPAGISIHSVRLLSERRRPSKLRASVPVTLQATESGRFGSERCPAWLVGLEKIHSPWRARATSRPITGKPAMNNISSHLPGSASSVG